MTTLVKKPATPKTRRLDAAARLIEQALERALKPIAKSSPPVLHEAMRYCLFSGGKRFRPLLCLGGAGAVGGTARQALAVACAVEMIHTYSLVHDDLPAMDDADERRGRPSCHRQFGEAIAILVGGALLTRAFELLSEDRVPNALAIVRQLGQASGTAGLIGGQVLDLECEARRGECGITELEEVARRKTAALITASVVTGGLAAGASTSALQRLRRYGARVGLAFQLLDDLHDGDGLARVSGAQTVRGKANRLIAQARQELAPFGPRAWILHELAEWLSKT